MNGNFMKNLVLHVRYPYAATAIVIMWLGMAVIIGLQQSPDVELLLVITAVSSLIIAIVGFTAPK